MLNRLFPRQIDNSYQGHPAAIWLFVPVLLMKTAMGFNVAGLNPWISSRFIIQAADGVPIDAYPAEAASMAVFLFAAWGLALLVLALLGVVVLIRYRAMLPLMFLALAIEQLGRKVLASVHLAASAGEDGASIAALINWGFTAALVLGLALSLMRSRSDAGDAKGARLG